MTAQRHSVSVAAAIVREDNRVLLIRRADNGHWEPPGGVLELDEPIEAGLAREVAEETGLSIEVETLSGVYKNIARGIVALVFRCHATSTYLADNDEVSTFHWATDEELDSLMDPAYAVRARDAIRYTGTPAIRTHDGVSLVA
ncbi:MAG: NUDIX domain-containing protein [Streptosporangiales bacterium]|nr:NUDIX domain-containing protein [Streptosporangiales bacterium]